MDPEPFKPPTFHSLPYCIFCQKGCKCIGICCKEPKKAPIKSQFGKAGPQSVTFPPGLKGTSTQVGGQKDQSSHTLSRGKVHPTSSMIPGLGNESSSSSTSLTKREGTHQKIIYITGSSYNPNSSIFYWQGRKTTPGVADNYTSLKGTEKQPPLQDKQKKHQVEENPWYDTLSYEAKKQILSILLKSSLNTIQTPKEKKKSLSQQK